MQNLKIIFEESKEEILLDRSTMCLASKFIKNILENSSESQITFDSSAPLNADLVILIHDLAS